MESITTARALTFEELKANDYRRKEVSVNTGDINVGDYVSFHTSKSGAWGQPIIGRVSRRTAKTLWINPIRKNCDDNLVMDVSTIGYYDRHTFNYWNINEDINLEETEKKTTANNQSLRKIPENFIVATYIDYMR